MLNEGRETDERLALALSVPCACSTRDVTSTRHKYIEEILQNILVL